MTAAAPARLARTLDQRREALKSANQSRFKRAAMKKKLRAGADPAPFLADPPPWLLSMKADKFLACLPRVGAVRATAILRTSLISPAKTVGGLSGRQRDALIAVSADLRRRGAPQAFDEASARLDPPPPASGPLNA